MNIKTLSDSIDGGLHKAMLAFFTLLLAIITPISNAHAQNGPQQCIPASISVTTSQASVAVGDEFDLIVSVTNSSNESIYGFSVMIGYLDDVINPQQLETTSILSHFQIVDSHHPLGRIFAESPSTPTTVGEFSSSIIWFLDPYLSYEWLHPGQTATLRVRLRAIGSPGTLTIPAFLELENYYSPDCDNTASTDITVTEGSLSGPLLIQKTLLGNDLHDCIRLGDELISLWHVKNTSDEDRLIRFHDRVPGYLFDGMNIFSSRIAFLVSPSGVITSDVGLITILPDGEFANLHGVVFLPAGWSIYFSNFYDVSGYAVPSSLQSTFSVWELESDTGIPLEPPVDAMKFTNPPLPVCTPLVTKTAVGEYCSIAEGSEIAYQVDIDRIILGSIYAYTVMRDLHPEGTSYIPTANPNFAGPFFEYYLSPQRTMWSVPPYDNAEPAMFPPNGNDPLFSDRIVIDYRLNADEKLQGFVDNQFDIRVGSSNYLDMFNPGKVSFDAGATHYERKLGDAFGRGSMGASKMANGGTYDQILAAFDAALPVSSVGHMLRIGCHTIDGYKFNDLNGNGVRDAGEPGVQSWMVTAQSSEGTFTAVTDADGYYRIEGLPDAVWQVREAYQLGWVQSAPGGEGFYNVQLGSQVRSARLDFGNWRFAQVSGTKYHDIDGSGHHGDGEPGVEGVRVELRDLNGQVLTHTFTDGAGRYGFAQVPPGHYVVNEDRDTSTRQSQPGPSEGGFYYIVATSNGSYPGRDFGNYMPIEINGSVVQVAKVASQDLTVRDFRDLKIQLVRTGPTYGGGVPVKAVDTSNGASAHEAASAPMLLDLDENGAFQQSGLQPGNWLVSVVLAEYWSVVSRNPVQVLVTSGFSANILFEVAFDALAAPEVRTGSITGSVFRNTTADHLFDKKADVMVTGHTVLLNGRSARGASVEHTATTGPDGSYRFADLPAGEYVVSLAGVADSLRRGWPNADAHRVILGEDEHVGSTFAAHASANPPMAVDADLPWTFSAASAYANLATRLDDDGDGRADRRNFFSGPAGLARTSAPGERPLRVAHTVLRMAGTDSLGRTIMASSPSGGSLASIPSANALGNGGASIGTWTQGLDLTFVLEGTPWYGPTAVRGSTVPDVSVTARISEWLSLHTAAGFTAEAGNAPVVRDPFGTPMTSVLSATYVLTPGPDFGLTPKRFDAEEDGDDDGGGTGSGGGGIGTNDPDDRADVPAEFALGAAYPNPFNPSTVVPFELASAGQVRLAVYDVTGRQVAVLVNTTMSAGRHSIAWDASGLPSGVYVVQLRAGGKQFVSKATLLK